MLLYDLFGRDEKSPLPPFNKGGFRETPFNKGGFRETPFILEKHHFNKLADFVEVVV